jgi:FlaA1/EpsC-like NDP-sugar epimerase
MLADLVIVHMSMVTVLAFSVMYQTASGNHSEAEQIIAGFATYYAKSFLPLSLLFPCGFLLGGFYTHSRGYADRYKPVVIVKGAGLTVLLFLAMTLLLLSDPLLPRSVAIPFVVPSALGVTSARVVKSLLVRRVERKLNSGDAVSGGRESLLVVGGAGYVGSLLVEALLRNGRKVRVLDNLLYGDASLLEDGIREIAASVEQGQVANYMDEIYNNCQFLEKAGSPPHRAELDGRLMAAFAQTPAVNGKALVVE